MLMWMLVKCLNMDVMWIDGTALFEPGLAVLLGGTSIAGEQLKKPCNCQN